jgi:class 3 adenylate cyclase
MGLKEDLETEVMAIFASTWETQITKNVPAPEDLRLNANHAKYLETATVLYADLDGSTNMVESHPWQFSAEIYRAYLRCAAEIIRNEGGVVTAYDGDRVMAVFTGDNKNTSAVKAALKINHAVEKILRPEITLWHKDRNFQLKHVIGIDTSQLHAARVGVHGDNDIVWVGRSANYAAKLSSLSDKPIWITGSVYDRLNDQVKLSNGKNMWVAHTWNTMNKMKIYSTTYHQPF